MAVDESLGPRVGVISLVLVVEGDGGHDLVDAAPAHRALVLAVGPAAEVGNHLLQGLVALESLLLVVHGVAPLLDRLLAVLVDLFVLVLGDNVETFPSRRRWRQKQTV